ncbi:MAG: hypothetical protein AAB390_02020 [Patescibacteria group bacterium]
MMEDILFFFVFSKYDGSGRSDGGEKRMKSSTIEPAWAKKSNYRGVVVPLFDRPPYPIRKGRLDLSIRIGGSVAQAGERLFRGGDRVRSSEPAFGLHS